MRVVSLTCSNTEILWALGATSLLVGVDDHSDFPVDVVSRLPRVGPDLDIDVERVAALAPDLVLASLTVPGHERVVERLDRARLPYLVTEPVSVADVARDVRLVGERIGLAARAGSVAAALIARLAGAPLPSRDAPRVLVEWWPKPVIVPGRLSWVTDLLARAGARNPFGDDPVKSRPVTDDEVRAVDPDAIVISWCGVRTEKYRPEIVLRRPAWREVRAVREGRVFPVAEAYLGRPGPRLVSGLEAIERVVAACRG